MNKLVLMFGLGKTMNKIRVVAAISVALSLLQVSNVFANNAPDAIGGFTFFEPEIVDKYKTLYKNPSLGDGYDPSLGAVRFSVTDIDLPGNFNIPVSLTRQITPEQILNGAPEGWSWDIPYIKGTFARNVGGSANTPVGPGGWNAGKNCTGTTSEAMPPYSSAANLPWIYWEGKELHIPGETTEKFLAVTSTNGSVTQATKSNYFVESCITIGSSEEGFVVRGPDGKRYTFGKVKAYDSNSERHSGDSLHKFYKLILITKIEDRFGNTVDYFYNSQMNLESIEASDGRKIQVYYKPDGEVVDYAIANGKRWNYRLIPNSGAGNDIYLMVDLPDATAWSYDNNIKLLSYDPYKDIMLSNKSLDGTNEAGECRKNTKNDNLSYKKHKSYPFKTKITNPEGVETEYTLQATYHGRSKVHPRPEGVITGYHTSGTTSVEIARNMNCEIAYSLRKKVVSGEGFTPLTWNYSYSQNNGKYISAYSHFNSASSGFSVTALYGLSLPPAVAEDTEDFRTVVISSPESKVIYYIDRRFHSPTEGSVIAEDYLSKDGSEHLKRVEYTYLKADKVGKHWFYFGDINTQSALNANLIEYRVNLATIKTTMYYADGSDVFYTHNKGYDALGFSAVKEESNSFSSYKKFTRTNYSHNPNDRYDTGAWVLGLPTTTELSGDGQNYNIVSEITYHTSSTNSEYSALQLPYEYKLYGNWVRRFPVFHSSMGQKGRVKKIEFNYPLINSAGSIVPDTYRYQLHENYKRGRPQKITVPNRYSANSSDAIEYSRVINDDGRIVRVSNLNGDSVDYGYDLTGRLKYIDLPGRWLDTLVEWTDLAGVSRIAKKCKLDSSLSGCMHGTEVNQVTSRFDDLYRLYSSEELDSLTGGGRYQYFDTDVRGLNTLTTYKDISNLNREGVSKQYDGLGRVVSSAVHGGGNVTTVYLSQNKVRVRDAEDNDTTTQYLAYEAPDNSVPLFINSPENVITEFKYNIYGDLYEIKQSGPGKNGIGTVAQTEYRAFDAMHNLCKRVRKDVGIEVWSNNLFGEPLWRAQGVTGGSNTNCLSNAGPQNKITYVNDNLGDLFKVNYPDSTPDITYTHDNNGNIIQLMAGSTSHVYTYNELDLIETETLTFPSNANLGATAKSYRVKYTYNDAGQAYQLTYPNDDIVKYSPNGFGEAREVVRQASSNISFLEYASDIKFYPSGVLDSFKYGNGILHKTLVNERRLPRNIKDSKGSNVALHYDYTFDNNLNVKSIIDNVNGAFSLTNLSYDGLDRLTGTTGNSGIGSSEIRFDGLGNITYYSSKNSVLDYSYNTTLNTLTTVNGSGSLSKNYSFVYDSRGNVESNGSRSFTYNLANQMVVSESNRYAYDGFNRRIIQKESSGTSYSFYSKKGELLYRELPEGGVNYIYLAGRLIAKDGYMPENNSKQHYKPFGSSIEGESDDVGYTGHKFDRDLGLTYMQARYYDPVIGRFYSNDPVGAAQHLAAGNEQGFGRYTYANNNPMNATDPTGEYAVGIVVAVGGMICNANRRACGQAIIRAGDYVAKAHKFSPPLLQKDLESDGDIVDSVKEGAEKVKQKQGTELWEKKGGGDEDREDDFHKLVHPDDAKPFLDSKGNPAKTGPLRDGSGRWATTRTVSTDKRPTLEIKDPKTGNSIKIRYGEKT